MLAVDLGAESGRTVLGSFDGDRLAVDEIHRFANHPVEVAGTLYWDVLRLYGDIIDGVRAAKQVASLGIDTWGVDFGLVDRAGKLLGNPVHYRDRRTEGIDREAFRRVPREEIYRRTGVQFMAVNTLYQLLALSISEDPQLAAADRLLTMPALFAYWLTGVLADEFTDVTTTQCYDPIARTWAFALLERLDIPARIFGEVIAPGTDLGPLRSSLDMGPVRVIAPGTHDTASAVAAVPFDSSEHAAYISSGTWSLVGVEATEPIITDAAMRVNLTNEGGVAGTFRLLKNVMGLWLLQECRRSWARRGHEWPYDELLELAEKARPFEALIDPDDGRLLRPGDMPIRIAELSGKQGKPVASDPGFIVRCILESLALKYRRIVEQLEQVTGSEIQVIHVVGGGARNRILCQMTADACGRVVLAGPVEATAIGNLLVQAIALRLVASLEEARQLVKRSVTVEVYEPKSTEAWEEAALSFSLPTQRDRP